MNGTEAVHYIGRGFGGSFSIDQTDRPGGQRRRSYETMPKWHSFTFDQTDRIAASGGAYVKLGSKAHATEKKIFKSQAPNSKQIPNSKLQIPNKTIERLLSLFGYCDLVLGACLELGIWCLGFFCPPDSVFRNHSSLKGRSRSQAQTIRATS